MRAFSPYVDELGDLASAVATGDRSPGDPAVYAALDGGPSAELRRRVKTANLRRSGAFFTGSELSTSLLKAFVETLGDDSVIFDPACGAGDLLIHCAQHLEIDATLGDTLTKWRSQIIGRDLHDEFVQAARTRLILCALHRGVRTTNAFRVDASHHFANVRVGSGLTDVRAIKTATHIVMNPPFSTVVAPLDCEWRSGRVNSAALFMETCIRNAEPGTRIAAILPDVLRSGTGYAKWRELIAETTDVVRTEPHGRFARWADVDVFFFEALVTSKAAGVRHWPSTQSHLGATVGDRFEVGVGAVVDYRDAKRGDWSPFLRSHGVAAWSTVVDVRMRRRFWGKVVAPPFVVIRRNSRPGDIHRAVGSIVRGKRPVAVENHLMVLRPRDGRLATCVSLLETLRDPRTSAWLNQRIRCRHLTVPVLRELPWWRAK